ncbi:MAG: hypothetical protein ILM98_11295 [Kiritimatiellae bacterium]|nr:hypothetical protein [Kiritimatiellia bacterium]
MQSKAATAPNFGSCLGCARRILRRVCRRTEASFMRRQPCHAAVAAPRQIGKAALRHGKTRKVKGRKSKVEIREGRALSRPRRKALRQERKPPLAPSP